MSHTVILRLLILLVILAHDSYCSAGVGVCVALPRACGAGVRDQPPRGGPHSGAVVSVIAHNAYYCLLLVTITILADTCRA